MHMLEIILGWCVVAIFLLVPPSILTYAVFKGLGFKDGLITLGCLMMLVIGIFI